MFRLRKALSSPGRAKGGGQFTIIKARQGLTLGYKISRVHGHGSQGGAGGEGQGALLGAFHQPRELLTQGIASGLGNLGRGDG